MKDLMKAIYEGIKEKDIVIIFAVMMMIILVIGIIIAIVVEGIPADNEIIEYIPSIAFPWFM